MMGRAAALAAAVAALTGCATLPPGNVPLRLYTPDEIIVPSGRDGRIVVENGCLLFRPEVGGWTRPLLFRAGTRWADGRSLLLPDGTRLPVGRSFRLVYERPPVDKGEDRNCGAEPLLVIGLR